MTAESGLLLDEAWDAVEVCNVKFYRRNLVFAMPFYKFIQVLLPATKSNNMRAIGEDLLRERKSNA